MNLDALREEIQEALRNDLARARRLVSRLARHARARDDARLRAEVGFQRAQIADMEGRARAAATGYEAARRALARLGADDLALAADVGAVQAYAELGDAKAARRIARRLRRLELPARRRAGVEIALGTALETLGDDRRAEESYRRALAGLKGRDRRTLFLRATARQNMSICMVRRGAAGPARRELDRAVAEYERLGLEGPAEIARFTRGWAHGIAGRVREAFLDLQAARAAFEARGRKRYAALTRLDEADLRARLGDFETAAGLALDAAKALGRVEAPLDAERARLVAARAELATGAAKGRRLAERARETLAAAGDRAGAALAAILLGRDLAAAERTLLAHGNAIGALQALLARAGARGGAAGARVLAERASLYPAVLRRWVQPEIQALRAHGPQRIARLRKAFRAVEDLRRRAPSGTLRATTLARHLGIYDALAQALLQRDRARDRAEAFLVLDAARVRTLREEMEREAPGLADRPDVRALRERLEALWRTLERREGEDHRDLRSFQAGVLKDVAGVEREFLRAVEASPDAPAPSAPSAGLPADACLSFAVLDGRVVGLHAADGRVRTWDAGPLAPLRGELDAFLFQVNRRLYGGGDEESARAPLARLADALLGGAPPDWRGPRLRVVLPPELGSLPFEALPVDGEPVAAATTVSYSPFACARPARRRRAGPPLIVGIESASLPEVAREIAAVRRRLPGADVLQGADAERGRILAALPGRRVIHVAGHAEARDDLPLLSALRVRDGWLAAADLGTADLRGALVVLSACRTGDPSLRWRGESMAGFPRALLAAGAAGLIASRWEIHDSVARDWMVYFYRVLPDAGPAAALAEAARQVRRRWPHPADWAAFLCIVRGGFGRR